MSRVLFPNAMRLKRTLVLGGRVGCRSISAFAAGTARLRHGVPLALGPVSTRQIHGACPNYSKIYLVYGPIIETPLGLQRTPEWKTHGCTLPGLPARCLAKRLQSTIHGGIAGPQAEPEKYVKHFGLFLKLLGLFFNLLGVQEVVQLQWSRVQGVWQPCFCRLHVARHAVGLTDQTLRVQGTRM